MKIKEIMSKDVEIVSPDTPLQEVAKKMQQRDCGCVVVVKDDRLVGMITDRDLAIRCIANAHDAATITAENVMTPEILYCRESDDADDVARNMSENKVRRLPVLNEEKRLVGIVSLGDLASHSNHELCGQVLGDICRVLSLIVVAVIIFDFFNLRDNRTGAERLGDAVSEMPNGIDKAAEQLKDRTPAQKAGDAVSDAVR